MELTDKELEIIARRRAEKPYTKRMGIAFGILLATAWLIIPFEGLGAWRLLALSVFVLSYIVYAGWQMRLWEKATRRLKSDMDNELCGDSKDEKQAAAVC